MLYQFNNALVELTLDANGWRWDFIDDNQTPGIAPIGYAAGPGNRPDLQRKVVVWIDGANHIHEQSAGLTTCGRAGI